MARRVAMVNHKGGVGKSSVTIRLAEALAKERKRVLVVDMDPQGNASRRLGWHFDESEPQPTISQALKAATDGAAHTAVQPIGWDAEYASRMAVIPARLTLENRMSEAGEAGAWRRLDQALEGVDDSFDYTLIDCPPSLAHLTQLGLAAADDAVIVTWAEQDSIGGSIRVRDFIRSRAPKDLANPGLTLRGVIINDFHDTAVQGDQRDSIRRIYQDQVWDPIIKHRTKLAEADNDEVPLSQIGGDKAAEIRASFELLAQAFLKAVPAK